MGGLEFVKLFEMIKKQWKEQKQVVRKHKTLIVLTKKGNEGFVKKSTLLEVINRGS